MGAKGLAWFDAWGRVICRGNLAEAIISVHRLSSDFLTWIGGSSSSTEFPVFHYPGSTPEGGVSGKRAEKIRLTQSAR